ncbi:D-glycero-beta-D-manno-heptose 1,7-bisphosphate 7-phosphatase [Kallotenue papyrolyticum]|uniref:D-glycero-beta-D-manno-heptose 1,7-bisphosphate 7-phosphatase n=1 Tax=Kallotenue papyrolyticum TaxID=1325125 RepID=UPI0004926D0C|nr:D-glycero-beta-D-manno-heptose 1,7-bisphosphate 7-phosphatase [Kallotenue papyrolyticum]
MTGRAVFLDRDGTINVEVNYLHRCEDLVLIPGAAEAIRRFNRAGWLVVVVTNQAGIARGFYDEAAMHALHAHLRERLAAAGARIDAFYFCPHHPDFTGPCVCRKPADGMLRQAARDHAIDLARSWLIGDSWSDLVAGHAAGCRTLLVRTGYGRATEARLADMPPPDTVVDDLLAAARWILGGAADTDR